MLRSLFPLALSFSAALTAQDRPPNVVVIVSDDAGYADFSAHGSDEVSTPRIDSIAYQGIRLAHGYVSASVCSPSRAGLLTGRYQQRFGHHNNIPPKYSEANGLDLEERTMADALKASGYRTIALGKWHLGYAPKFHPLSRGFDDYFGFLQGARSFFPLEKPTRLNRLLRDRDVVDEDFDYMTDELGREAARYIEKHKDGPFFLYLSFNAVHTPMHAKADELAKVDESIQKKKRRKLIAMTHSLDQAVGEVLDALDEHELTENTIVVFVNDNGGATNNASDNGRLRGRKGSPFEGGIRVPFFVRWPKELPQGLVYGHPVSTLDILPTCLAAAKSDWENPGHPLDGVNLLPFLRGDTDAEPHQMLCWKRKNNRAVRSRDLKLVSHKGGDWMLFDIVMDPSEERDLAEAQPKDFERLKGLYELWERDMVEPRW